MWQLKHLFFEVSKSILFLITSFACDYRRKSAIMKERCPLIYFIVCALLSFAVESFQIASLGTERSIQPLLRASTNNFLANLFKTQSNKANSLASLIQYVRKDGMMGLNDGIKADVITQLQETSSKLRKPSPANTYKLCEGTWRVIWTTEKVRSSPICYFCFLYANKVF